MATGDVVDTDNAAVEVGFSQSGSGVVSSWGVARPAQFGGASTSARGFRVSRTVLGGTAYILLPPDAPMAYNADMAASFALFIADDVGTAVTIAAYVSFPVYQCTYVLHPVGNNLYSIRVYHHATSTLLYESRERIGRKYCSTDSTLACATDAECPSSGTCTAPQSWGMGYWAEMETRAVVAGSQIQCQLWIWGRQQHPEEWFAPGANVYGSHNVFIGLPFGEAQMNLLVDDVVWARNMGDRIGAGHVGILHPNANGSQATTYKRNGCDGTSTEYWKCVWPWRNSGYPTSTGAPGLRAENPRETQIAFDDPPIPLIGTITGVQFWAMLYGSPSGGSWQWNIQPRVCPGGACTLGAVLDHTSGFGTLSSGQRLYVWRVDEQAPTRNWDLSTLQGYELYAKHLNRSGNTYFNLKAMAVTYYVRRREIVFAKNLLDHDVGVNDNKVTVALVGDSLTVGTASVTCTNNDARPCNQDTYCSWDAPDGESHFGDIPTGGCVSDQQCRTCVGRRAAFNGGAGVPCASNAECPQTGGTCNTTEGVCVQNEHIPCATNADCNGFGGICDTTATCDDACPGGDCPVTSRASSWSTALCDMLAVDNCLRCGLGGERLWQMVNNRWDVLVTDPSSSSAACTVARGEYAQPDYLIVYEGANDIIDVAVTSPNCTGIDAGWDRCKNLCSEAQKDATCLTDSECQSLIGPGSRCLGATKHNETSTRGDLCHRDRSAYGQPQSCSMSNGTDVDGCGDTVACPNGMTCVDATSGRPNGICVCTEHAQCPTGFRCVGGRCRRACTSNSGCVQSGRAGSCTDPGDGQKVCVGRCTCPCDMRTCTTDADCDWGLVVTHPGVFPYQWWARGVCTNGRCAQCGTDLCGASGPYPHAYQRAVGFLSPLRLARILKYLHQDLQAREDAIPPDGLPIMIYVSAPDWPDQDHGCERRGRYHDPGWIRQGSILAARAGVRVVDGMREEFSPYYQTDRGSLLHTDHIHNTALGGLVIARRVKRYLDRLNACRRVDNDEAQKYCYSLSSQQFESTTCSQDADCTNPATVCRSRKCTSEADCPAADDFCAAE